MSGNLWSWDKIQDTIIWNMPYGKGFWLALAEWPAEFAYTLNTVIRLVSFDCNGTWVVFVDTLKPAAGEMAIALLSFGWDDVARGFLRPSGIRARHRLGRRGRKGGHRRARRGIKIFDKIPEIGEWIGKHLPGATIVRGRNVGGFQRWLWTIDGVLQRGVFYWMMVDVISDFGYAWLLGIMRHEACWTVGEGWAQGGPGWISFSAGQDVMIGYPRPVSSGGDDPPLSFPVEVPPGRRYYFFCELGGCFVLAGSANTIRLEVRNVDTGEVIDKSPELSFDSMDDKYPVTLGVVDKPGRYAIFAVTTTSGFGVIAAPSTTTAVKFISWPPKHGEKDE